MAQKPAKKRVKFKIKTLPGSQVYVAGTFNGWDPEKDKLTLRNGAHSKSILLPRGRYEYKFVINGTWQVDPNCKNWVTNDLGSINSVIDVK